MHHLKLARVLAADDAPLRPRYVRLRPVPLRSIGDFRNRFTWRVRDYPCDGVAFECGVSHEDKSIESRRPWRRERIRAHQPEPSQAGQSLLGVRPQETQGHSSIGTPQWRQVRNVTRLKWRRRPGRCQQYGTFIRDRSFSIDRSSRCAPFLRALRRSLSMRPLPSQGTCHPF